MQEQDRGGCIICNFDGWQGRNLTTDSSTATAMPKAATWRVFAVGGEALLSYHADISINLYWHKYPIYPTIIC